MTVGPTMLRIFSYVLGVASLLGLAFLASAGIFPFLWTGFAAILVLSIVGFVIWQVDGKTPID